MTGIPLIAVLLLAAGVLLAVAASVAAVLVRAALDRVHFLTVITSMAAPLVAGALAIANGWGLTTGQIVLTVGLLAVTGPVLGAAIGRLARVTADVEPTEGSGR